MVVKCAIARNSTRNYSPCFRATLLSINELLAVYLRVQRKLCAIRKQAQ